jgi:anti-anti-sigma regulatory factor
MGGIEGTTATLTCAGALTLATVDVHRTGLLAALDHGGNVVVDCSGATDVDLSFLQLLVAGRLSADRRGRSLTLLCAADGPVRSALLACGLPFPDSVIPTESKE